MTEIAENIKCLRTKLPANVGLVAVSKFNPPEAIMEAYAAGQRMFGESRAQEFEPKAQQLPSDIEWHFIGHLQTNKVKHVVPYVACIQSIDSEHLLAAVDAEAAKIDRVVACLLQFHVAAEETKYGFTLQEAERMLQSDRFKALAHVRIAGIMGMATQTIDQSRIRADFALLKSYFDYLKTMYFVGSQDFNILSMGMTHDYDLAVAQGATLVRVGSGIFGERMYCKKVAEK